MSKGEASTFDKKTLLTPRTDAARIEVNGDTRYSLPAEVVDAEVASGLERELADMTTTRDRTAALLHEAIEENSALRSAPSAVPTLDREFLGRVVRMVWVEWAHEQPTQKASWLKPWEELTEPEREVDRRIGEKIARLSVSSAKASSSSEAPHDLAEFIRISVIARGDVPESIRKAAILLMDRHPSSEQPTSAAAGSTKAAKGDDSHREGLATESHERRPIPAELAALLKRLEKTPPNIRLAVFSPAVLGDVTVGDLQDALSSATRGERMTLLQRLRVWWWKWRYAERILDRAFPERSDHDIEMAKALSQEGWNFALEWTRGDVAEALTHDPIHGADEELSYWTD